MTQRAEDQGYSTAQTMLDVFLSNHDSGMDASAEAHRLSLQGKKDPSSLLCVIFDFRFNLKKVEMAISAPPPHQVRPGERPGHPNQHNNHAQRNGRAGGRDYTE